MNNNISLFTLTDSLKNNQTQSQTQTERLSRVYSLTLENLLYLVVTKKIQLTLAGWLGFLKLFR